MAYLLMTHFNIEMVVGDYNGGVYSFLSACNESGIFKKLNLKMDQVDADLDNLKDYVQRYLRQLKRQHKSSREEVCIS